MVPSQWTTFRGQKVSVFTIDQQHLSNCWWYGKVMLNLSNSDMLIYKEQLEQRFNGQLLPYRPHVSFKAEIEMLEEKKMLFDDEKHMNKKIIMFGGLEIGEILLCERPL